MQKNTIFVILRSSGNNYTIFSIQKPSNILQTFSLNMYKHFYVENPHIIAYFMELERFKLLVNKRERNSNFGCKKVLL